MADRVKPEEVAALAGRHLDCSWTPARTAALEAAIGRRLRIRRMRLFGSAAAATGLTVGLLAAFAMRGPARPAPNRPDLLPARVPASTRFVPAVPGAPVSHPSAGPGNNKRLLALTSSFFKGAGGLEALCDQVDAIEVSPFDGLIVTQPLEGFWNRRWSESDLAPFAGPLRCLGRGRLGDNFLLLTLNQVDWADDGAFSVVLRNARLLASFLRDLPVQGIFFDTQTYVSELGHFAVRPGQTFAALEPIVRRRGAALMQALQEGGRPLAILYTMGVTEAFRRTCVEGRPLAESYVALLPAFIQGMTSAITGASAPHPYLADAFIGSYPTEQPTAFPLLRDLIHGRWAEAAARWQPGLTTYSFPSRGDTWAGVSVWPERLTPRCSAADRERLSSAAEAGFGVMLDYEHDIRGGFALEPSGFARNHLTPAALAEVIAAALDASDRYVWLQAVSVSFWPVPGEEVPLVPREYLDALRSARR